MAAKKIPLIWNNIRIKNEKKINDDRKKKNRYKKSNHDEFYLSCLQQLLDEKIHTHTLWTL